MSFEESFGMFGSFLDRMNILYFEYWYISVPVAMILVYLIMKYLIVPIVLSGGKADV